jgi:hypothetical protein
MKHISRSSAQRQITQVLTYRSSICAATEFWHLIPIKGREPQLESMRTARSHADIQANIDYVELDPDLYLVCARRQRAR